MHLWPNFIGIARSERNTRSGFKGSRVCDALLIKLVRIRDRRGIKRTVEKAEIEEEETKNNNEGDTSGGSRPHFPIPRQSIITCKLENFAEAGGSHFCVVNLAFFWVNPLESRTLWLLYVHAEYACISSTRDHVKRFIS